MSEQQTAEHALWATFFPADFAKAGSDAMQRLFDRGHAVTQMLSDWNVEYNRFVVQRLARNGDTVGRLSKCESLPDIMSVEAGWVQEAMDDYIREMSTLAAMNTRIVSVFAEQTEQGGKAKSSPKISGRQPV